MQGWISLHRKIRENPVFYDLQLLRLWIICLTEASHKEHDSLIGKQVVKLQPGQFLTGRFDLHKMYNDGLKPKDRVTEYTVWRWLLTLGNLNFLQLDSSNKFTIVTIVKWRDYQSFEQQSEQQNEQQVSNKRAANEQQMSTNNNVNNVDNENKGNKKPPSRPKRVYDADSIEMQLSIYLLGKIREINPETKQPDLNKWSDDVRLMIERDNRTKEQITEVLKFMYEIDTFWRTVILSPGNFREKFDKINTKRLSSPSIRGQAGGYSKKEQRNRDVLMDLFRESEEENEQARDGEALSLDRGGIPEL